MVLGRTLNCPTVSFSCSLLATWMWMMITTIGTITPRDTILQGVVIVSALDFISTSSVTDKKAGYGIDSSLSGIRILEECVHDIQCDTWVACHHEDITVTEQAFISAF